MTVRTPSRPLLLAGAVAGVLAAAAPVAAQTQAFVARLGNDTVAVERYTRRGDVVRGVNLIRSPQTLVRRYELRLARDGSPLSMRLESAPPGGTALETTEWTWRGDSVIGSLRRDTVQRRWRIAAAGRPFPFVEMLFAPWDLALRRARGGRSMPIVYVRQVLRYALERQRDGATMLHLADHDPGFDDVLARRDAAGGIEVLDLTATTSRYLVRRVGAVDVDGLAVEFARREKAGKGLGALSPRDTVRALLAGAHVLVDYSRPAMRGRPVFGGLLAPFGQVWRTGADAATQLITDHEIAIEGQKVPPGTYSLFSIPSAGGWTLILNREHGQWGTDYHPDRDLARIPMQVRRLTSPVERFTISVTPASGGGVLKLTWADREGSVGIAVP